METEPMWPSLKLMDRRDGCCCRENRRWQCCHNKNLWKDSWSNAVKALPLFKGWYQHSDCAMFSVKETDFLSGDISTWAFIHFWAGEDSVLRKEQGDRWPSQSGGDTRRQYFITGFNCIFSHHVPKVCVSFAILLPSTPFSFPAPLLPPPTKT